MKSKNRQLHLWVPNSGISRYKPKASSFRAEASELISLNCRLVLTLFSKVNEFKITPIPDDKISDMSKSKAFPDDKFNAAK